MESRRIKRQLSAACNYSYTRLALNYYMYYETSLEDSLLGGRLAPLGTCFHALLKGFLDGNHDVDRLEELRNRVTCEMEAATAYTDVFQAYEYVLNRLEGRYAPQLLGAEAGAAHEDDMTQRIMDYICLLYTSIGDAKEESVNTILEMARYREEGRCRALIVAGCLAQRYKQEILDEIPEVDAILGTTSYEEIAKVLEQVLEGEDNTHIACFHGLEELPDAKAKRVVTTGGYYAFLKISEGCDKRCTYCIIPYLRGPYRSVPIEELVEEASQLARDGVKELILVAQETTLYGKDIYGEKSLPRLSLIHI